MRSSRGRSLAAILLLTVLGLASLVSTPVSAATLLCSGVTKAETAKCDPGWADAMNTSYWGMYKGHNCTNYVAWKLIEDGVSRPSVHLGNAVTWAANAKKSGLTVNSTPAVGSVGAWPGKNHVVYVEEVGSNYLVLSEDNYPGYYPKGMYRKIRVTKGESAYPTQFIHFRDPKKFAAPSGLDFHWTTESTTSVSWKAVPNAPRYRLQYSTSSSMSGAKSVPVSGTKVVVEDLKPSTKYYFRVVVVDAANTNVLGSYSSTTSESTFAKAYPANLRSTDQTTDSIDLAWSAVSGASAYKIQLATNGDMDDATYLRFTGTSGTLSGLKSNTRYWFRITALDSDGKRISAYTAGTWPSATTLDEILAPTDVRSSAQNTTRMNIRWNEVDGADRYQVQYSTSESMSSPKTQTSTETLTKLTDLKPGTRYHFRVAVVDDDGALLSPWSAKPFGTATTLGQAAPLPKTPTGVTATPLSRSSLQVAWTPDAAAERYRVQLSTSSSMSKPIELSTTEPTATFTGLATDTPYWVRVAVVDAADSSVLTDYSTSVATRTSSLMASPTSVKAPTIHKTVARISWKGVANAPAYRVQYSTSSKFTNATTVAVTDTTAAIRGLTANTRYWFRVAVVDANDTEKLSNYSAAPWPSFVTKR